MRTEAGVQQFWGASLAWRGISVPEGTTIESLFRTLDPLYAHPTSFALQRQAQELGDMIVGHKRKRKGKNKNNIIPLPIPALQKAAAA